MVPTIINGRWTLLLPEHRAARPQWDIANGGWETERLAAMYDTIKPADVVFDIGAEEGDLPALWATWGAEVVLFEPNPYVWPNIRVIWEANRLPLPRWFAGFAANETVLRPPDMEPIFAEDDHAGWPACAWGPVIGDHGFRNTPDVITMDVEGAELEVLRGAAATLRSRRPVVFVSIHPTFIPAMYPYTADAVHEFMAAMGYTGEHLATDHEEHWRFAPQ